MAGLALALTPYLRGFAPEQGVVQAHAGADQPRAMGLLLGVIALRSVAWFALITFVPDLVLFLPRLMGYKG